MPSPSLYHPHKMMDQAKQQTWWAWWDSPKFTIDCVLANATRQLEADGCVLERIEGGCKLSTPDHLRTGDFVKVQLWLEGEDCIYRHPTRGSQKSSRALGSCGDDPGEPQ